MSLQDLTYEINYNVDDSGLAKSAEIINNLGANLDNKVKGVESAFKNIGKSSTSMNELLKSVNSLNVDNLSNGLKNVISSSNELNASTERQQRLSKLVGDYIDEHNAKLEKSSDLTEQWNNRTVELNQPLSKYAEDQQKLNDEIYQATNKEEDLANSAKKVSDNTGKAKDKTDELKNSLTGVKTVSSGISSILGAWGIIGIGNGLVSGIKGAIGAFSDFQQEMATVHATLGDVTNNDLTALSNKALETSSRYAISAKDISSGMQELASHGLTAKQVMDTIQPSTLLAVAGNIKMKDSTLDISAALRNFNLDMDQAGGHVADVYAKAAAMSAAAMPDMAEALKNVAPIAGEVGISLENTAASIGLLSDKGIKGATAGTDLKIMLERLITPVGKGATLIHELGFSAIDPTTHKMKDMGSIVRDLSNAFESHGLTTAPEKNSALSIIFGKEALPGTAALFGTAPKQIDDLTKSLQNSDGAAQKMTDTMNNTLAGSLRKLKANVQDTFITDIDKTNLGKSMKKFIDDINKNIPTVANNLQWLLNTGMKAGSDVKQNWGGISSIISICVIKINVKSLFR